MYVCLCVNINSGILTKLAYLNVCFLRANVSAGSLWPTNVLIRHWTRHHWPRYEIINNYVASSKNNSYYSLTFRQFQARALYIELSQG